MMNQMIESRVFIFTFTAAALFFLAHCGLKTDPIPPELVKEGRPVIGVGAPKIKAEADEKELLDLYGDKKTSESPKNPEPAGENDLDHIGGVDWNTWPDIPEIDDPKDDSKDPASSDSDEDQSSQAQE